MENKKKTINKAISEKKFIDFNNYKTHQELEEYDIKYYISYVVQINKLIVKNYCRKTIEKKLIEIKEEVNKFDNLYEKRAREGLPSCWGLGGTLLSWYSYEPLLVLEKRKV